MSTPKKQGKGLLYDPSFKVAVAREYLSSSLGYGRLAAKHNLPGARTVRSFVEWYKTKYQEEPVGQTQSSGSPAVDVQTSRELKDANLKIAALETLIEVAKKELGIDIVKKFGARQSRK
jgi:transposase-like protein